ncbi:uncharacterized protein MONBRDRAFT_26617 [Monosiga brevicollis MX1]|uniref:Pentacotripeptide-repeat region of PRORP domain-containing protein n=1 Tax=Monosiga brevicollis TaxID=81824 RepID=A9V2W0_MONBE|nr:uncharacterized protein MONBRDRAFT_26617 [Monosiga brevicollis MX1]EDQ88081.1 predicted protein [Monosiga brevicollis MX1]|eukprot:XP_001747157.1 hypothetical protein [Monosiga brevicollis MX1]
MMATTSSRSGSPQGSPRTLRANKSQQRAAKLGDAYNNLQRHLVAHEAWTPDERRKTVIAANKLLALHAKQGNYKAAEDLYHDTFPAYELNPDTHTFNTLMNAAVQARKPEKAREWLALLQEDPALHPDQTTWNTMLGLYVKCNDAKRLHQQFLELLDQHSVDKISFNTYLGYLAAHCTTIDEDILDEGLALFRQLKPRNIHPDGTTMGAFMRLYLHREQPQRVVELFEQDMPHWNLRPCNHTVSIVILAYHDLGRDDDARRSLVNLWQSEPRLDEDVMRSLVVLYGSHVENMIKWIHDVCDEHDLEWSACLAGFLVRNVAKLHGSLVAERCVASIRDLELAVDNVVVGILLQAIADDAVENRQHRCLYWLEQMKFMGCEVNAAPLTSVINAFGREGDAAGLLEHFHHCMRDDVCDELMFRTALNWLKKLHHTEGVHEIETAYKSFKARRHLLGGPVVHYNTDSGSRSNGSRSGRSSARDSPSNSPRGSPAPRRRGMSPAKWEAGSPVTLPPHHLGSSQARSSSAPRMWKPNKRADADDNWRSALGTTAPSVAAGRPRSGSYGPRPERVLVPGVRKMTLSP